MKGRLLNTSATTLAQNAIFPVLQYFLTLKCPSTYTAWWKETK
jgi:hypothetical protein